LITLHTLQEIKALSTIDEKLKDEIIKYFKEVSESIVVEQWESYNISEVGSIIVVEDGDNIQALEKYNISKSLPEFAERLMVGDREILKIVFVLGDCFGITVFYPVRAFGNEFYIY
jgi:hypothetical protein